MATLKLFSMHGKWLSNFIDTCVQDNVYSTLNLKSLETANDEMQATKDKFNARCIPGYSLIQAFPPNEVSPEICHKIGVDFANRLFGDNYEAIIVTHTDTNDFHNHIVVNATNRTNGKNIRDDVLGSFEKVCLKFNAVCAEYGVKTTERQGEKSSGNDELLIQFLDANYKEIFTLKDCGLIRLTAPDGYKKDFVCRYLNDEHFLVGERLYSPKDFAETMKNKGVKYAPAPEKDRGGEDR